MASRPARTVKTSKSGFPEVVARQRRIQKEVAKADKKKRRGADKPMQAGARRYPVPPLPKQHQPKPGSEAGLDLAPMYDAPFYKGSEKLKGKIALITGGDSGIGRRSRSCSPAKAPTSRSRISPKPRTRRSRNRAWRRRAADA
jgi:hypothetical protein